MSGTSSRYFIALFDSVSHVLQSEKLLKKAGVSHKIVPVPREISSECGVCIRFLPEHRDDVENALAGKVDKFEIRQL
ncbi:MAG: DUF3343 domain-containing protein [Spirochaetes bacterium]|nr:DUF3343 domain-containing protein [Spirochaetota bacterium]